MAVYRGGQADSGIDRALDLALQAELDDVLASGELWPGEREAFPDPVPPVPLVRRPWQQPMRASRKPPASDQDLGKMLREALAERGQAKQPEKDPPFGAVEYDRTIDGTPPRSPAYERERDAHLAGKPEKQRYLHWRDERVGIVVVHGIGPHLAGQTLLEWTRPIISLLDDAAAGDPNLVVPEGGARDVTDPVFKANIDFSGETFPTIQVRIPRRDDVPPGDPRGDERRWVFTEAWWASEVRPPSLATMIGWLGSQGGVGRIVQGIQQNMLGTGPLAWFGKVSLQPIVSVITSFVLLVFAALLALSKIIPIGPLKDAVVLKLAASFLTDWFGGARTLLRDPAQSANVRTRVQMTIKALRAYGCRNVVIVAHSGGTMVSLMTLTDPAFPELRAQKLITIGEALNLGWRLNDANPDEPPPTPPPGDRMRGDLAALQPQLQWRDFWATHDPAPSGRPQLPTGSTDPGLPRFSAERVYNRMAIAEDHGTYWDNDEHFLIPLIREIDVPTGDRASSRFYSDRAESVMRARRKERVGLLALWRRSMQALPLVAILAAASVSAPGIVPTVGDILLGLFGLIPGHEIGASLGQFIVDKLESVSTANLALPAGLQPGNLANGFHSLGLWALGVILVVMIFQSALPTRIDRLWTSRLGPRLVVLSIDLAIGLGTLLLLPLGFLFVLGPADRDHVLAMIPGRSVLGLIVLGALVVYMGVAGQRLRTRLRSLQGAPGVGARFLRDLLITLSSLVLGTLLIALVLAVIGILVVVIRADSQRMLDTERFVLGAIGVLFIFRLLTKVGTWRWDSWDARERRWLRRTPFDAPYRSWPYLLATILSVTALLATMLVAFGHEHFEWLGLGRDAWVGVIALIILVIVVVCLGKDTVDNDIDQVGGGGGGASGMSGAPAPPIEPDVSGPAAAAS